VIDATDRLADPFERLNGFGCGNGAPGVQVWPAAGAAKQSVDVNDPGSTDVRSSLMFGAAAKVMKPGIEEPGVVELRSMMVPAVLLRPEKEPELPLLLTVKAPSGGPAGG